LFRIVRKCGAWQSVFGVPIEIGKTSDKSIEIYKTKSIKKMHKCGRGSFGWFWGRGKLALLLSLEVAFLIATFYFL